MKVLFKNATILNFDEEIILKINTDVVVNDGVIEFAGKNYAGDNNTIIENNMILLPNFSYNLTDENSCFFSLKKLTEKELNKQLKQFNLLSKTPIMFIDDVLKYEQYYDLILSFCKRNNIKIVVKVGTTLNEMGECDKLFNLTPIELLESYGILDQDPIILSGTNLDKQDFEILSNYNISVCLNLTQDLIEGNGIAPVVTIKKHNLNIFFNSCLNDVFKEMFLCYTLPRGILNDTKLISAEDVLKMAVVNKNIAFSTPIPKLNLNEPANFMAFCNENKSNDDVLENIVLLGDYSKIKYKFVGGKTIK